MEQTMDSAFANPFFAVMNGADSHFRRKFCRTNFLTAAINTVNSVIIGPEDVVAHDEVYSLY